MDMVIHFVLLIVLLMIDIFGWFILNDSLTNFLNHKKGAWVTFGGWIILIIGATLLYSWMPGRMGYTVQLLEGAVTLEDGAILSNLGWMCLAQAVLLGFALLKQIWAGIRQKRFFWKQMLIELVLIAGLSLVAEKLMDHPYKVVFSESSGLAYAVLIVLCGGSLLILFKGHEHEKKQSGFPDDEEFQRMLEERKSLMEKGDYQSLVFLLIKSTELRVSSANKAIIWNYLGRAYEEVDSQDKAVEAYTMASKTEPKFVAPVNNLALIMQKRGDYDEAIRLMEMVLKTVEKSDQNKDLYQANMEFIKKEKQRAAGKNFN